MKMITAFGKSILKIFTESRVSYSCLRCFVILFCLPRGVLSTDNLLVIRSVYCTTVPNLSKRYSKQLPKVTSFNSSKYVNNFFKTSNFLLK